MWVQNLSCCPANARRYVEDPALAGQQSATSVSCLLSREDLQQGEAHE
jgi:hypothetical protein